MHIGSMVKQILMNNQHLFIHNYDKKYWSIINLLVSSSPRLMQSIYTKVCRCILDHLSY